MPMPMPMPDESKTDFMERCMGNDTMMSDFPDQKQRVAVCMGNWRKKGTKANFRKQLTSFGLQKDLLRNETLNGREYLVAPVIPIVEGVHNGEFVSFEEIAVFPEAWDGRPLPIDHPQDENGEPVTANDPKVMEQSVIGFLFNVVARKDLRGISGEVWIDIEKAQEVAGGKEVITRLQNGEQLEVSTGYFTMVEKSTGEFKNPDGTIEKYKTTQTQIRPDHLALLPFDLGACSWEDGCGAGRINKEKSMADEKSLKVNGKQLSTVLTAALAVHGDSEAMMTRLAAAAGIDTAKVKALMAGELDFVPRQWLAVFSTILDIDPWDLMSASSNDNSTVRYATNEEEKAAQTTEPVTTPDNASMIESSTATDSAATITVTANSTSEQKPCAPCEKTFGEKVQAIIDKTLTSLGFKRTEQENKEMTKKERIDALIASTKTRFAENNRQWLESLDDATLESLEPVVEQAAAETQAAQVATNTATEKPAAQAATAAPAAETKVVINKDEILAAIGISAEDIAVVKANADAKKAERARKINTLKGIEKCPYTEAELNTFSDSLLDRTVAFFQPEESPFRAAAGTRQNTDAIPMTPSILLAPVKEGK